MIFSEFIENLLGDRVKIRVYRVLARHAEGMTGRGIASLIRTSPFKISQVLRGLVSEGIVESVSMGRANLYRLNQRHVLVHDVVLFLVGYEEAFWPNLGKKILNRLHPKPLSIILYGSIARGEEGVKSDMDIHLVYDNRRLPKSAQLEQPYLLEEIGRIYGNPLSITRSTVSEFQRRSREREPLIRNIIKEGRVLVGMPLTELLSYGRALGKRSSGKSHLDASGLLSQAMSQDPEGRRNADRLAQILNWKHDAEYEPKRASEREAYDFAKIAERFVEWVRVKLPS